MRKAFKILYVCPICNSDNVEYKSWVNPNTNSISTPDEADDSDCWCCDCETHNELITIQLPNNGTKVIGFQVVSDDGNIHPAMAGSFCLYSLSQANEMLMDNFKDVWKLRAIYTGEIEVPTKMYTGKDPRI